jgi:hypothetical protein
MYFNAGLLYRRCRVSVDSRSTDSEYNPTTKISNLQSPTDNKGPKKLLVEIFRLQAQRQKKEVGVRLPEGFDDLFGSEIQKLANGWF